VHGHRGIIAPIRGRVTIDDLAIVMVRSRHEIQKKLIELGLSAVTSGPNDAGFC
jgi:hypothetical protein